MERVADQAPPASDAVAAAAADAAAEDAAAADAAAADAAAADAAAADAAAVEVATMGGAVEQEQPQQPPRATEADTLLLSATSATAMSAAAALAVDASAVDVVMQSVVSAATELTAVDAVEATPGSSGADAVAAAAAAAAAAALAAPTPAPAPAPAPAPVQAAVAPAAAAAATVSGSAAALQSIDMSELELGDVLGDGAFAVVRKSTYRGTPVAVKMWRNVTLPSKEYQLFQREVDVFDHPNVVRFFGSSLNPICIVTEFVPGRDLWELIHDDMVSYSWGTVRDVAAQVARGLDHIHSKGQLHRDVKSLNILCSRDFATVKLCDFGLSRFTQRIHKMTGGRGTTQWMAPEMLQHLQYDEKVDVYSFGITLWEMATREAPYHGEQPLQVATRVVQQGYRPPIPAHVPSGVADLIRACWAQDPRARPTFVAVLQMLASEPVPAAYENVLVPPLRKRLLLERTGGLVPPFVPAPPPANVASDAPALAAGDAVSIAVPPSPSPSPPAAPAPQSTAQPPAEPQAASSESPDAPDTPPSGAAPPGASANDAPAAAAAAAAASDARSAAADDKASSGADSTQPPPAGAVRRRRCWDGMCHVL